MIREIIKIDEEKCNGCGDCVPNCHEGALQIIDGKAVLVSDLMCDGLGACIGHCPMGALEIEKREADEYNETLVMQDMVKKGKNVVIAHLKHLKEHGEEGYLKEGVRYLWNHKPELGFDPAEVIEEVHQLHPVSAVFKPAPSHLHAHGHACPGSRASDFSRSNVAAEPYTGSATELTHWPVQLHLINPAAGTFSGADILVAADCSAFAAGGFHSQYLKNRKLVIACPKLDQGLDVYRGKLGQLAALANTITILRMEVPCCGGLTQLVKTAVGETGRKVPVKEIILSIKGEKIREEWI